MYLIILLCIHLSISALMYIREFQKLKSIKLTLKKEQGRLKFDLLFLFIYYMYFINNYQKSNFFSFEIDLTKDFKLVILLVFYSIFFSWIIYTEFFQKKIDKVKK